MCKSWKPLGSGWDGLPGAESMAGPGGEPRVENWGGRGGKLLLSLDQVLYWPDPSLSFLLSPC